MVCSLKVVDDDGNIAFEGKKVKYAPIWQKRANVSFDNNSIVPFLHNNKMMVCTGNKLYQIDSNYNVSLVSSNLPINVHSACSFQNSIWIVQNATSFSDSSSLFYKSTNGETWIEIGRKHLALTSIEVGKRNTFLFSTDSLIFVSDVDSLYRIQSSTDGINWNTLGRCGSFYPLNIVSFNNLIYEFSILQAQAAIRNLDWTYKVSSSQITGMPKVNSWSDENFIVYNNHIICPCYDQRALYYSSDGFTWKKLADIPEEIRLDFSEGIMTLNQLNYLLNYEGLWSFE